MAETYRKSKVEHYIERLTVRQHSLRNQVTLTELTGMQEFLKGQISAIDVIIHELRAEFGLGEEQAGKS